MSLKKVAWLFLISILCAVHVSAQPSGVSAPKYELRGVWIATAFGIDFPKTTDAERQKAHLDSIFKDLHARKFNAVFFQVRVRADVLFETSLEPYHEYLSGVFGKRPEYDVVQYALDLSRKYGLEFHAWFNTMILRGRNSTKKSVGVPSLWERHPEWIDKTAVKNPDQETAFLNPASKPVQNHLIALIVDFATRYDVDGIQLDDYLRYPQKEFDDDAEFRNQNPNRLPLADWRRETITTFVGKLHDTLLAIKPCLKFGVTPIGVYRRIDATPVLESYSDVYQDSRAWTKRKLCDYLAPQLYYHIGATTPSDAALKQFNPPFEKLVEEWCKNKHFRHLYVGIGVYKPAIKSEWKAQVEIARKFGAEGVVFYPYSASAGISFEQRAMIPPMTWKRAQPPLPPENIAIERRGDSLTLSWTPRSDVRWVNVYRKNATSSALHLQHIAASSVVVEAASSGEFFLTAIDRCGNESKASPTIKAP